MQLVNAAGSLTSFWCSADASSWYGFDLSVDGGAIVTGCGSEFNGYDITGFSSLTITSHDDDAWSDAITITIDVEVTYSASSPPSCDAMLTSPSNGDIFASTDGNITWSDASGGASGYKLTVGTTSGGSEVLATTDVGDVTTYALGTLAETTEYFVNILPYNALGDASGCTEYSFTTLSSAVPANDECVDAEAISCGDTVIGSTEFATDSGNNTSNDVWYVLAGTANGEEITASLCGSDYDTYIRIFDACGGTEVAFNDDASGVCSPQSQVTFTSDGATTYYIMVEGFSSNNGNFDLAITCVPPPACTFVVIDSSTIVDSCNSDGTGTFTVDHVISDAGDAGSVLDDGINTYPITVGTVTTGPYNTGDSVTIDVTGVDAACDYEVGTFTYTCPLPPPANDNCSGVIDLGAEVSPLTATTALAGNDFVVDCLTNTSAPDVVYSILVPDGATLVIGQTSNAYDSKHRLAYGGACPGTTLVACTDDPDTTTEIFTNTTGSDQTAYWVQSAYSTGSGEFTLEWSISSCPDPTTLTASNVTETSADLGWTEAGTATTWNIEWGTAPLTQGAGTMVTGITTNPYALTGLTTETEYEYYVQADCGGETSAWSGPYTFSTSGPVPANDECVDAEAISCGDTVSGSTEYATDSGNNASNDVWYVLAGTSDGDEITASLCGSGYDTYIRVFDACGGTQVAFNDDASGVCSPQSEITFTSDGATTYYIMVEGWSSNNGDFDLAVSCVTLSAQDFDNGIEFSYYPNPVNDNLTLKAQKDIENIAVYNMLGQEVLRTAPNTVSTDVDMSNLQAGAYFVKVTIGTTTETVRVIKN
ncbi:T9SS type A sorting domain-containing protein [Lacinutrix sp. C3R15]|uniref:T9SS type A sorting domain-containing protein n=1 Tax=Flavobacteriaceae TaxID=49546 RepID=UPI001C093562|nr:MULTISPECIES: T9SS type A sorting domain-containing protein [Flavobacteriaceae]MBU2940616.1 T9SS type A sorting domain-containing protein [Lacinutrix sp. C3R15]MDO6623934.1 T9SS type A sorting domain-containing protein [Oceanihabitans sp. 1_MG-2023]